MQKPHVGGDTLGHSIPPKMVAEVQTSAEVIGHVIMSHSVAYSLQPKRFRFLVKHPPNYIQFFTPGMCFMTFDYEDIKLSMAPPPLQKHLS